MSDQEKKFAENICKKANEMPEAQDVILAFAQGLAAGMNINNEKREEEKK